MRQRRGATAKLYKNSYELWVRHDAAIAYQSNIFH